MATSFTTNAFQSEMEYTLKTYVFQSHFTLFFFTHFLVTEMHWNTRWLIALIQSDAYAATKAMGFPKYPTFTFSSSDCYRIKKVVENFTADKYVYKRWTVLTSWDRVCVPPVLRSIALLQSRSYYISTVVTDSTVFNHILLIISWSFLLIQSCQFVQRDNYTVPLTPGFPPVATLTSFIARRNVHFFTYVHSKSSWLAET